MIEKKALQELDFYKILGLIEEFAGSEATKKAIQQIFPFDEFTSAENSLKEFEEIKRYFDTGGQLQISSFPDIANLIEKAKKEGAFFEPSELTQFLKVLRVLDKISSYIDEFFNFPFLSQKIKNILKTNLSIGQPYILERLENTVDEEGNILDTASSTLKYIRKQIKLTEEKIKQKLEEIINRSNVLVFLQDRFITKRNNRWVIPVRMDSKGQIPGVVHDVSRSGETAFIEPAEITAFSKKLEELLIEQRLEEIKILKELSFEIHQISETLHREFNLLVYLDKMLSIYKFSQKFNAEAPQLTREINISLINAKHPLLLLSKQVVPLNLELKNKKVLVITGPNAGGKTVTIKTIGLLTAMAISGLPIPASPSSIIPFVKNIYVDLYHEGSIEEHLSSFALHIITLKKIIEQADSESLILLDEIGTNTDPEEGSALACAILEELKNREALTFATTHLSKVKIFAATQQNIEIASMLFDEKTMTPLYKLSIGSLTPSYALEVAQKYGFPENLIRRAYELKGTQDREIYELIKELEKNKQEYETKLAEIEKIKNIMDSEKNRLEKELVFASENKKKIIEQAKIEAQSMLTKLKKEINFLYEEAKKADRKKLREISQKISDISKKFISEEPKKQEELNPGDIVKIRNLNLSGKILIIEDGRAKIQTDTAQIEAELRELEKVSFHEEQESNKRLDIFSVTNKKAIENYKEEYPSKKLDIRGMRVDEAIPLVERFLNELSFSESNRGIILHGIGKGILRDAIRDYIKDHPAVKSFRKGNPDEGGDAVTVIEMK
ncbi:endonuclease MutS2 [Thermodesulfovibrio sp. Kuro-1]|uniref:endonuclease MutS2 n=1 Tax=Thermodesulfovibrio sp. Kuro-1 TaxID=2580394 RepID=UPI001143A2F9|nr:endonuclease MutS2 [Thermodesulfovibrio sp. Kuro-1]